jgi:hypothetical protein
MALRAASVAGAITCMVRARSKVKVTREHFYGTGRAGDTMKHAHAALPPTAELQVCRRAPLPAPQRCAGQATCICRSTRCL